MVDSSVGGKTAIDLPSGKNLAGAFYQPNMVICDLDVLNTLPESIFIDGCAEVIKYGILFDKNLFEHLAKHKTAFERNYVIPRCIELKRDIVENDEFERGPRKLLNLGHTIGHAIEKLSNYDIPHGRAVAAGTAIAARIATKSNLCSECTVKEIEALLLNFTLPAQTDHTAAQLYNVALSDKKATAEAISLILPKKIGQCIIQDVSINELESIIELGL